MKQFFSLLTLVVLISMTGLTAQTITPSGDVEIVINALTTRAQLDKYTEDLKAQGIKLNITAVTFNSANGVRTIAFEVVWGDSTAPATFYTDNMRTTGDIWIIKNATTHCVGDCK